MTTTVGVWKIMGFGRPGFGVFITSLVPIALGFGSFSYFRSDWSVAVLVLFSLLSVILLIVSHSWRWFVWLPVGFWRLICGDWSQFPEASDIKKDVREYQSFLDTTLKESKGNEDE